MARCHFGIFEKNKTFWGYSGGGGYRHPKITLDTALNMPRSSLSISKKLMLITAGWDRVSICSLVFYTSWLKTISLDQLTDWLSQLMLDILHLNGMCSIGLGLSQSTIFQTFIILKIIQENQTIQLCESFRIHDVCEESTFQIKRNEWGFMPPLCTYWLNWAKRTS